MGELFFAGCNGFGTIYLMHANGTDEFVAGSTRFSSCTPRTIFSDLTSMQTVPITKLPGFYDKLGRTDSS